MISCSFFAIHGANDAFTIKTSIMCTFCIAKLPREGACGVYKREWKRLRFLYWE